MEIQREEIINALQVAREREEPVVLSPRGMPVSFLSTILHINQDWVTLRNPIPPLMAPWILQAPSYGFFCRMYWLTSDNLVPYGTHLRFPLPEKAQMEETRQKERVAFSERDNAVVKIVHPFDPATQLTRQVFDVSEGGMSFRVRTATPFIQPGRVLPSCEIYVGGRLYRASTSGRVVYVKQIVDVKGESYFQVGVHFSDAAEGVES